MGHDLGKIWVPSTIVVVLSCVAPGRAQEPSTWTAGRFRFTEALSFESRAVGVCDSAWVDLDADGDLDLLTVRRGPLFQSQAKAPSDLLTFRNEGAGRFEAWLPPPIVVDFDAQGCDVGDMDDDGAADVLLWGAGRQSVRVVREPGSIHRLDIGVSRLTSGLAPFDSMGQSSSGGALWADVDCDGDRDIVSLFDHEWCWFPNADGAGFERAREVPPPADVSRRRRSAEDAACGDIDLDGDVDIVIGRWLDTCNEVLLNEDGHLVSAGDRMLPPMEAKVTPGVTETMGVLVQDLDADARPDIVFSRYGDYSAPADDVLLHGRPEGLRAVPGAIREPGGAIRSWKVAAADFDLDDDPDLFFLGAINAASYFTEQVSALSFEGAYLYTSSMDEMTCTQGDTCAVADVDGDGDPDLFVGDFQSRVLLNASR